MVAHQLVGRLNWQQQSGGGAGWGAGPPQAWQASTQALNRPLVLNKASRLYQTVLKTT
jgi:hypothetical protein